VNREGFLLGNVSTGSVQRRRLKGPPGFLVRRFIDTTLVSGNWLNLAQDEFLELPSELGLLSRLEKLYALAPTNPDRPFIVVITVRPHFAPRNWENTPLWLLWGRVLRRRTGRDTGCVRSPLATRPYQRHAVKHKQCGGVRGERALRARHALEVAASPAESETGAAQVRV